MMLTGTMANHEILRTKILSEEQIKDIHIIRSDKINQFFVPEKRTSHHRISKKKMH